MKNIKDMGASDLEKYLAGVRITPSASLDESVRRMADEAQEANEGTQERHALSTFGGFFSARRCAAVAALLLVCVLGALAAWVVLDRGASSAWAAVEESVRAMPWVHIVQKDPVTGALRTESWYQSSPQRTYMSVRLKNVPGYVAFSDHALNEEWLYQPDMNVITIHSLRQELQEAHSSFVHQLMKGDATAFTFGRVQATRRAESKDGVTPFEILTEVPERAGGRKYLIRVWVDDSLRLPVRAEIHRNAQEGKPSSVVSISEINYPKTGPDDIYAIGIPKDVTIMDARLPKDVSQILSEYENHRQAFPKRYQAILVSTRVYEGREDTDQEICVVSRDGLRQRMDIYLFTPGEPRPQALTFDEARAAIKNRTAQLVSSSLKVEDGRVYWLHAEWVEDSGSSAWKVTDGSWVTDYRRIPENLAWPPMSQMPSKTITGDAPDLADLIGIEFNLHVRKDRYWFNPKRDLIADRWTFDPWSGGKPWERSVLEYARLPDGRWYPRHVRDITDKLLTDVHMEITENPAIATDTFDPASLRAPTEQ